MKAMKMSPKAGEAAAARIVEALAPLAAGRGGSAEAYRSDPYSIRVRVVSPAFVGVERTARHGLVSKCLQDLPDELVSAISFVAPVTPAEKNTSGSSLNFDDERPKPRKKPKSAPARRAALRRAS